MPRNPELVDATDLDQWAERREAQELLPRFIRLLLTLTPGVTGVSVRAGEGIGVPGPDGHAIGSIESAFVPIGPSLWEIGTGKVARAKAQSDYRKRTDDPQGIDFATTTFVFVTPRRWGAKNQKDDKDAWVREKQAESIWRGVVALDADDLEGWLDASPSAHIWLSERMGRRPVEIQTLDRWWESWLAQTRPGLPAPLILAGRRNEARELRAALLGQPDAIGLRSGSRGESIAFIAASLLASDDQAANPPSPDSLASVLVVSTPQEWARIIASPSHFVLVPDFDGADVAMAVRAGHYVVIPTESAHRKGGIVINLPRLGRDEASAALQAAGWAFGDADKHAAQARRSLQSLRRSLAVNPALARPAWANRPAAESFAPLMLVGGWSDDSDADWEVVDQVTGQKRDHLERDLGEWATGDDAPFRQSGGSWKLAAPLDAWELLQRTFTRGDLARWHDAALRILSEPDPSLALPVSDRPLAGIHGIKRAWSEDLRRGLAVGAALLGAAGDEPLVGGQTGPERAASLVHALLARANNDVTGRLWQSLSDVLPLLSEAAPEQFLDAVGIALDGEPPVLRLMFTDSDQATAFGVSSPHTGLLWALETLCWSPPYLSRATDALARLAEIDPGGRLSNRPIASLRGILLPWFPQTSAPLQRRLDVIKRLLDRHPTVGWPLILALLPAMHDISLNGEVPTFREWKPDHEGVSGPEHLEAVHQLVALALAAVQPVPGRWVELVPHLQDLPADDRGRILDALGGLDVANLDQNDRLALWTVITKLVAQHRQFETAPWSLPDEPLTRLEEVAARVQPLEMVERHARLFDWYPDLPGTRKDERQDYDRALNEVRVTAIKDTLQGGGVAALERLAQVCKLPHLVGVAAADVGGANLASELLPWLSSNASCLAVARGFIARMVESHGWEWVDQVAADVAGLSDAGRNNFLLSLPIEPRTWTLVDRDADSTQNQYWKAVGSLGIADDHLPTFIEQLLNRSRPWSAIDLLAMKCHGNVKVDEPLAKMIERALRDGLDPKTVEIPRPGAFEHDVGALLDSLEAAGASTDTMFELEWAYYPILERVRRPRTIHSRLNSSPQLFTEAVCAAFRGKHEAKPEAESDSAASLRARNCYSLLRGWRQTPGSADDGSVDATRLRSWVSEARRLLAQHDRVEIGDTLIGELLSGGPVGKDGVWPAEPIRDLLEDLESTHLESGLITGKSNSRGVTWRGVYDGGKQERSLSEQFRSWAGQVEDRWPHIGRVLRELADRYEREARQMDESAEKDADEG